LFAHLRIDGIAVPLQRAACVLQADDGGSIDAQPDLRQVERVLTQLAEAGATPWTAALAPLARRPHESAFQIRDDAAVGLVEETIDQWQQRGWEVVTEPDFPWQLVELGDLELKLHEGKNPAWLDLDLGMKLGDRRISLLPALETALATQPPDTLTDPDMVRSHRGRPERRRRTVGGAGAVRDAGATTGSASLQVRLDDQHIVRIPWERLEPLLDTLVELGDRVRLKARHPQRSPAPSVSGRTSNRAARRLRIARADLGRLSELAEHEHITWVGAPDLRQFAQRLAHFQHIEVAPIPVGLRASLRPYQHAGLNWLQFLRQYELGGLLADDMGLGKTLQTLSHILLEQEQGRLTTPALVVAPTSLVHNWVAEAARFAPSLRTLSLHGTERWRDFERIPDCDLVITSFALLTRDIDQLNAQLQDQPFHLLIVDEAQHVKNPRTQAAAALRSLRARHRLALTGTPLENHLGELWAQFDWIAPGLLGDQASFTRLYRAPIEKLGDEARREHLTRRIRPFVLRRRKDEVAPELPPRTDILRVVALEGQQRDLYEAVRASMQERVRQAFAAQGMDQSQFLVLDALLKLRQICCDPRLVDLSRARHVQESAKLDLLLEMLDGLLADGRKVLIFSQFTSMLALIESALQKRQIAYALLTGDTRDRAAAVEQFQGGSVSLFLLSLKAGGTGLNLTAADTVIHYDPWWNPAAEAQATDRAHRIGQDKPVFVYRLLCAGTIEERMRELQLRKAQLAQALLGDEAGLARALSPEDIEALLAPGSLPPASVNAMPPPDVNTTWDVSSTERAT
jgi:superfamily II DNA or RNA helicase